MKRCKICGDEGETKCTPEANCLNVSLEMEMKAKEIQPSAFHHWLMKETGGDAVRIAKELTFEIMQNQNPQVLALLDATGDKNYTPQTFFKASEILITICSK